MSEKVDEEEIMENLEILYSIMEGVTGDREIAKHFVHSWGAISMHLPFEDQVYSFCPMKVIIDSLLPDEFFSNYMRNSILLSTIVFSISKEMSKVKAAKDALAHKKEKEVGAKKAEIYQAEMQSGKKHSEAKLVSENHDDVHDLEEKLAEEYVKVDLHLSDLEALYKYILNIRSSIERYMEVVPSVRDEIRTNFHESSIRRLAKALGDEYYIDLMFNKENGEVDESRLKLDDETGSETEGMKQEEVVAQAVENKGRGYKIEKLGE